MFKDNNKHDSRPTYATEGKNTIRVLYRKSLISSAYLKQS